jgi:prepilin-type N-terminal cleavage/methylation domain-containing protein
MSFQHVVEEIQVLGANLVEKVKELIHEGNVQRVIIKNEQGFTLVEIPVTLAVIGGIAAPVLAAVGAIAAMVTKCTVVVERKEPPVAPPPPAA